MGVKVKRWLLRGAGVLLGVWAVYVLCANVILNAGLVPRWVNGATDRVKVGWRRAITVWPGQAWVKDFRLRFDEGNTVQLDLTVDDSSVQVSMLAFARRTFQLTRARATGASYRMSIKVSAEEASRFPDRIAAFPQVEGFEFPPLKDPKPGERKSREEIDRLWRIELSDVESDMREIWINEYRYLGGARVKGSFALAPLKELSVGPATATFQGGMLSAGVHPIFPELDAKVRCTIAKADVSGSPEPILPALTASLHTRTRFTGAQLLELYLDGVQVRGAGPFAADVEIEGGRVLPQSTIHLELEGFTGRALGMKLEGQTTFDFAVSPSNKLVAKAITRGELTTPPLGEQQALVVELRDASAEAWLSTADLGALPAFELLSAKAAEASAADARPLTRLAARYVPVVAPAVLGEGPLVATARARVTPKSMVLTVDRSSLGSATLSGAALKGGSGWSGAARGRFGRLSLGLALDGSRFGFQVIADDAWLDAELKRLGFGDDDVPGAKSATRPAEAGREQRAAAEPEPAPARSRAR